VFLDRTGSTSTFWPLSESPAYGRQTARKELAPESTDESGEVMQELGLSGWLMRRLCFWRHGDLNLGIIVVRLGNWPTRC